MNNGHLALILSRTLFWGGFVVMNGVLAGLSLRHPAAARVWFRYAYGIWCVLFFGLQLLLGQPDNTLGEAVGLVGRAIELAGVSAGWLLLASARHAGAGRNGSRAILPRSNQGPQAGQP